MTRSTQIIAAAFLLAGCGRDLSVPAQVVLPAVAAFAPATAFASELITLQGTGFDPVPARNTVHFRTATAAGESVDPVAGTLSLHVPIDAGSGPIAVATVAGLGTPSGAAFAYRGIGHLRTGQSSTSLAILHRPPGIAAVNGDLYLASSLFRFIQSREGQLFHIDHRPGALVAANDQSALYASVEDPTDHFVYRIDLATNTVGAPARLTFFPRALAAAADVNGPLVVAAGDDGAGTGYITTLRGDASMAVVQSAVSLPVVRLLSVAVTADGRQAALVAQQQTTVSGAAVVQTGLLIVNLDVPDEAPVWIMPPGSGVPTGAIALLPPGEVAVGFDDGTIGNLALTNPPAWSPKLYDTLSNSPVGGLVKFTSAATGASAPALLASKAAEGSLVAFDVASRDLLWGIPVRGQPVRVAADPAGLLYAADETSNFVDAIDGLKGVWLNRVSFEPGLGNPSGAACGAVYDPAPLDGSSPRFLVVARNAYALALIDASSLQLKKPINLVRGHTSPALCVGVGPDKSVWVLHQSEIGRIDSTGKKEVIVAKGLPVPPIGIAFTADGKPIVSFPGEAAVVNADGSVAGGVVFDGAVDSVIGSGDQVFATWTNAGAKPVVPHAALWPVADFIAGNKPALQFDDASPDLGFSGSIRMPDRTLFFYEASAKVANAIALPLDGSLQPGPEESAPVKAHGPLLVSPDGRYFLWTKGQAPDLVLHLTRAVAGQSIVNVADMPIPGRLTGAAFDPQGERLIVPIDTADSIAVFE